jgi:hypothetical protein
MMLAMGFGEKASVNRVETLYLVVAADEAGQEAVGFAQFPNGMRCPLVSGRLPEAINLATESANRMGVPTTIVRFARGSVVAEIRPEAEAPRR